jgi:hypothetical protein
MVKSPNMQIKDGQNVESTVDQPSMSESFLLEAPKLHKAMRSRDRLIRLEDVPVIASEVKCMVMKVFSKMLLRIIGQNTEMLRFVLIKHVVNNTPEFYLHCVFGGWFR